MTIHIAIKGARKEEMKGRGGGKEWWVLHPQNDAVLAYCDTEEEADKVITSLNEVSYIFTGQR
jgi:hypothetical protein